MMMKKKILIGSIFAALLMVSMPLIPALQNTQVATSKTTTSVQSADPSIIADAKLLLTLSENLKASLSKDPKTADPEQMKTIIQLSIKLLRKMGYTNEGIIQLAIKASNDQGYTINAALINKLQAVLNSNAIPGQICDLLGVTWVFLFCVVIILQQIPVINIIVAMPLGVIAVIINTVWEKLCSPETTNVCSLCAATGSATSMQSD